MENPELEGLKNIACGPPEPYFVYVSGGRHVWRFVYFASAARDGEEAIEQALSEARAMGNEGDGGYLAVPLSACTTRTVEAGEIQTPS